MIYVKQIWANGLAGADGDLAASEMTIYLDPTPGSAKLMVKAKNSSGTVVTGSVNLT